ncbi:MAG: L-serine ammonia-lyase [Pseudomonadota bacterium]
MALSVFEIFKIGVGPSSSHTMGPMLAANAFLDVLRNSTISGHVRVRVTLYGSLAFTGKGHATDRAVVLGLLGFVPATLDPEEAEAALKTLNETGSLSHPGLPRLEFDPAADVVFSYESPLPGHPNGLVVAALDKRNAVVVSETYYSIGGGFIATEAELARMREDDSHEGGPTLPFPFKTTSDMLAQGVKSGLSIAQMMRANELACRSETDLNTGLARIWSVMNASIERGFTECGILPGGLRVRRRAASIKAQLVSEIGRNDAQPHVVNDWISLYAMAVNEENAAGNQIVTAPTNGAAGVVPAVLRYYLDHCVHSDQDKVGEFLLTAAAIGGLIKENASISGAEVGCQGEVGSAAAMAAASLCAVLGGTNEQVENAAEIALEHHLGMTCDPAGGLVQVPCIERNGLGAIKAVSAASLALRGDGTHFMPLDNCIEAMRQTGLEMNAKFKETSQGGLAVNLPEC